MPLWLAHATCHEPPQNKTTKQAPITLKNFSDKRTTGWGEGRKGWKKTYGRKMLLKGEYIHYLVKGVAN